MSDKENIKPYPVGTKVKVKDGRGWHCFNIGQEVYILKLLHGYNEQAYSTSYTNGGPRIFTGNLYHSSLELIELPLDEIDIDNII